MTTLAERTPLQPCPLFDEDPIADFRWWAALPPGCGLLRRSSGMAMAVAAVANGALTLLFVLMLLVPRLVFLIMLLSTPLLALAGFRWCC